MSLVTIIGYGGSPSALVTNVIAKSGDFNQAVLVYGLAKDTLVFVSGRVIDKRSCIESLV